MNFQFKTKVKANADIRHVSHLAMANIGKVTNCSICNKTFSEPKILPCIHTICKNCLRQAGSNHKAATRVQMPCPLCGTVFKVPRNGIDGLSNDFYIERLVEISKILEGPAIQSHCNACGEAEDRISTTATMFCLDCLMNICEKCCQHHRKSRLTGKHTLVTGARDTGSVNVKILRRPACARHEDELKMFCSQCRKTTCPYCFIEDHSGHKGSLLKDLAEEFKIKMRSRVNDLAVCVAETLNRRQMLLQTEKCTEERIKELEQEVYSRRDRLKSVINKHAELLLLEIHEKQLSLKKEISTEYDDVGRHLGSLKNYRRYCASLLENGTDDEICRMERDLILRGKELKNQTEVKMQRKLTSDCIDINSKSLEDFCVSTDTNLIIKLKEILDKWENENPWLEDEQEQGSASLTALANTEIVKQLGEKIAKLEQKMEENELLNSKLKTQVASKDQELTSERKKNVLINQEIERLKDFIEQQKNECRKRQDKIRKMQEELENREKTETQMKTTIEKMNSDIEKGRVGNIEELTKNVKLREELQKLKQESQKRITHEKELQLQIKNLEQTLGTKVKSNDELETKYQRLNEEVRRLNAENSKLKESVRKANAELNLKQNYAIGSKQELDIFIQELEKERSENIKKIKEIQRLENSIIQQETHWNLLINSKTKVNEAQRKLTEEMRQSVEQERAARLKLQTEMNNLATELIQLTSSNKILQKEHSAFRSHISITFLLVLFIGFLMCLL